MASNRACAAILVRQGKFIFESLALMQVFHPRLQLLYHLVKRLHFVRFRSSCYVQVLPLGSRSRMAVAMTGALNSSCQQAKLLFEVTTVGLLAWRSETIWNKRWLPVLSPGDSQPHRLQPDWSLDKPSTWWVAPSLSFLIKVP